MGKSKLTQFLQKECPGSIQTRKLSEFKGKNIVIDANNFSYRYYSKASETVIKATDLSLGMPDEIKIRNLWIDMITGFISRWMKTGITPVFVFDGEPRPEKMRFTNDKRKAETKKKIETIEELKQRIQNTDPLVQNPEDLKLLEQKLINNPHPTYKDLDCFRDLVKYLGLPWFVAKHDAEQLCAILYIEGFADAVYSEDADTLIFGCRLLITKEKDGEIIIVELEKVLKGLDLTFSQFADVFILSKTDYNQGLPGMRLNRSLEVIRQYGRIENIPQIKPGFLDPYKIKGLKKDQEYPLADLYLDDNRRIFRFIPSMGFIKKGNDKAELYSMDNLQILKNDHKLKFDLPYLIDLRSKLIPATKSEHRCFYFL